ncbi:hypothetical protein F4814DRAFT_434983 [Daldinia grandis]|nr:hypothetical protein F4814DRAFT_434983 [Daldinia grandis]
MPPREIPGYYWDEDKKRYFKIEQGKTAPSNAPWSSDSVKKRKAEGAEAAEHANQAALSKKRIVRSETLEHPLIGGFFNRELGAPRYDHIAASFAHGIVEKGAVEFTWGREHTTLTHMAVTNRGPEGLCKVYASPDGRVCDSAYTLRDIESGRVGSRFRTLSYTCPLRGQPLHLGPVREIVLSPMAGIGYSSKYDAAIIIPRQFQRPEPVFLRLNSDVQNALAPELISRQPAVNPLRYIKTHLPWSTNFATCHDPIEALALCVAPTTSPDLLCVVGTTHGLVYYNDLGYMAVPFPLGHFNFGDPMGRPPTADTFSITFKAENPNILLFGGRPGRLFTGDLRCEYPKWTNIKVCDTITHVKQVSEHKVLVAGLRNMLSVFDTRYCASKFLHTKPQTATTPFLQITGFKNGPYLDLGLDVDRDSGVVAAAHDDGKMALYSVRSGRRLQCADVDGIAARGPIHCVQWETFVGDNTPSLFVGADHRAKVYSFGVKDPDADE